MSKLQQQLKRKEKERKNAGPEPVSAAAKAKAAADREALQCAVCKQTFAVTTKARELVEHAASKHSKMAEAACFPTIEELNQRDAAKAK